jgi:CRISPR/Cas system-associated protein Cas10 (large subunit of type III CRISPR-Cas system)
MEIFKGIAGVKLDFDEMVEIIKHDMLDDIIKLVATLDALELTVDDLAEYVSDDEDLRIENLLKMLKTKRDE